MSDKRIIDINKILEDYKSVSGDPHRARYESLLRLARTGRDVFFDVTENTSTEAVEAPKGVPYKLFSFIKSEIAGFGQDERLALSSTFIATFATLQYESESISAKRKGELDALEKTYGREKALTLLGRLEPDPIDHWLQRRARFSQRAVKILGGRLRQEIFSGQDIQQQYQRAARIFREMPQQFFPFVMSKVEDIYPLLPVKPTPQQPVIRFGHIFSHNSAPRQV